ncbi:MAG: carboxypeptidase regulatory-like domain-containing protein [Planctomycetes bacterium]|nr:carboxypeptidase regulatory-like domain-containing protein [Planctomycetota bacterium]
MVPVARGRARHDLPLRRDGGAPAADAAAEIALAPAGAARDGASAARTVAGAAAGRGFDGRAEDWLGGGGLAGAGFVFVTDAGAIHAVSDAQGDFAIDCAPSALTEVRVTPPAEHWTLEHGFVEREDGPLYRARFAPLTHGPLLARLVDASTGEALPEYVVRVAGSEGWSEVLVSDAAGLARSAVLFPAGVLAFHATVEERGETAFDDLLATAEFQPRGAEPEALRVGLPSGPTYTLQLELPATLSSDRLSAHLVEGVRAWDLDAEIEVGQPLRGGATPWVRFAWNASWMDEARLVLLGPGGRWRGEAPVDTSPGRHREPVHIRVEAMAALRGRVLDAEGAPVARAELELDGGDARAPQSRWTETNGRGMFTLEGLPEGSYVLTAVHDVAGSLTTRVDVSLVDGERRDFTLDPYAVGGEVTGTVRSLSGEFDAIGFVYLQPLQEPGEKPLPRRRQELRWERVGVDYVAAFRFRSVARARYSLGLSLPGSPYLAEPETCEVTPPSLAHEFLVRDDKEFHRLSFYPVDAGTGEYLRDVHLVMKDAQGEETYSGPLSHWYGSRLYAEDEVLTWTLTKSGYLVASGNRRAFDGEAYYNRRTAIVRMWRN